ncbi:MAG: protein kinase [Bacillota bacterium]|nr:protein kinase [Bacillota bacterium]NLL26760.1 protein kinase [Erysipelotrichia bacterium]
MTKDEVLKLLNNHIEKNEGIMTVFGELKFKKSDKLGEGGNGSVYKTKFNEKEIAVKFLTFLSDSKKERFRSEYFNTNYVRSDLNNVVNMIHYDELKLNEDSFNTYNIPYILMSVYSKNLKKYREDKNEITEEEFKKLLNFLSSTLRSIHNKGIIHRDIKPENILVDENDNFVMSDFGIAHYNKNDFPLDNNTKKGDRLANILFSAPEQKNNQYDVTEAADIYSMAQIMYWYVFEKVRQGTGAQKISSNYKWDCAVIYDEIIDKCLRNNPNDRFQSIDEILDFYKQRKRELSEVNPFDDMEKFQDSVLSIVPEFYNNVNFIEDKNAMSDLFNSIFEKKYREKIEFNTGNGNNSISSIEKLENDDFLMDFGQINIKKIWGYFTDFIYDDILLLELENSLGYEIDGETYYSVGVVENKGTFPREEIDSGYIRYEDKVYNVSKLNIQYRDIMNCYNIVAIAPSKNCILMCDNDVYLKELQNKGKITKEDIINLKLRIKENKHSDVLRRL